MNADDRLSRLPEEITTQILSLMPTKCAVQTSILSKRWRYAWTFVTNLDFDEPLRDYFPSDIFIEFVDRAMELRKSSRVKLFRLNLGNSCVPSSSILEWIDKAVRLNVHELDIKVMDLKKLPLSMFTCKTLTKLRLYRGSDYYYRDDPCVWEFPNSITLPCLKALDIAVRNHDFINAFKLIHGCPVLESLSLNVNWRAEGVEKDYIFKIPTLKRLKLIWSSYNKVILNAPNLEYLSAHGELGSLFIMEVLSSLVEAYVSFDGLRLDHQWVKGLSGVKSLKVASRLSYYTDGNPLLSPLPIFPNMTHLDLTGLWYSGLITRFLESSPELKHLCIDSIEEQPAESPWIEPKLLPACMLTNLTTFKFSKCEGRKCDIKFMEYILGNAKVLKTVTITWETLCAEEERRLVCDLPRASQYCKVHFS